MSHANTVFSQLLKLVSRHDFQSLAKQHHQGQPLRKISRWDQFVSLAMAQLSGRQSLRDIEANMNAQTGSHYHLGVGRIAKSSLARVNKNNPIRFMRHCSRNWYLDAGAARHGISFDSRIRFIPWIRA